MRGGSIIYLLMVSIQGYQGQSPYGQPYIYQICVSRFVPFFLGETIKLLVSRTWRRVSKSVLFTELSKFIARILGAVIRYRSIWYPIVGECNLSCFDLSNDCFMQEYFGEGMPQSIDCSSQLDNKILFIPTEKVSGYYLPGPHFHFFFSNGVDLVPKLTHFEKNSKCVIFQSLLYSAAIVKVKKKILSYPISCILHPILQTSSILLYPILSYPIPPIFKRIRVKLNEI